MMKRFFIFSLALLGITAGNWFYGRYVVLGGKIYPRNATVLVLPEAVPAQRLRRFQNLYWVDLRGRGLTVAEYEEISHVVGDARILWELDFQGTPVPSTAREIQIDHLSDEEVEALDYLPRLRLVRGESCQNYPQLLSLRKRRPDCQVNYRVELGGVPRRTSARLWPCCPGFGGWICGKRVFPRSRPGAWPGTTLPSSSYGRKPGGMSGSPPINMKLT